MAKNRRVKVDHPCGAAIELSLIGNMVYQVWLWRSSHRPDPISDYMDFDLSDFTNSYWPMREQAIALLERHWQHLLIGAGLDPVNAYLDAVSLAAQMIDYLEVHTPGRTKRKRKKYVKDFEASSRGFQGEV